MRRKPFVRIGAMLLTFALVLPLLLVEGGLAMKVWADAPVDANSGEAVVAIGGNEPTHTWAAFRSMAGSLQGTSTATLCSDIILDWKDASSIPLFSGVFNGNNHTIYLRVPPGNEYFTSTQQDHKTEINRFMGIFQEVKGGTVHNVRVAPYEPAKSELKASIQINPPKEAFSGSLYHQYAGGILAGLVSDGSVIEEIEVTGLSLSYTVRVNVGLQESRAISYPFKNYDSFGRYDVLAAGSIAGAIKGNDNYIRRCHSEADVSAEKQWTSGSGVKGGVTAVNTGVYSSAGGIAGAVWNHDTNETSGNHITACFYKGQVKARGSYNVSKVNFATRFLYHNTNAGGVLGGVYVAFNYRLKDAIAISYCVVSADASAQSTGDVPYTPWDMPVNGLSNTISNTIGGLTSAASIAGRISAQFQDNIIGDNIVYGNTENSDMGINKDVMAMGNIAKENGGFVTYNDGGTLASSFEKIKFSSSFNSIKTSDVNNYFAWVNHEFNGIKLKWRTWDSQSGPDIQGANKSGDKQITIYNPDGSEVTPSDKVKYSIEYQVLGRPASPSGARAEAITPAAATLTLGFSSNNQITAALEVSWNDARKNDGIDWSINADDDTVRFSGGLLTTTTLPETSSSTEKTAVHTVTINNFDKSKATDALRAQLPASWFPDRQAKLIEISLLEGTSSKLSDIPVYQIKLEPAPPSGVKYYYNTTNNPNDAGWTEYDPNNGLIHTDSAKSWIYVYAKREDVSGLLKRGWKSEVIGFQIRSDGPMDTSGSIHEADSPTTQTLASIGYYDFNGGFSLKDMLTGVYQSKVTGYADHDVDASQEVIIKSVFEASAYDSEYRTKFGAGLERPAITPSANDVITDGDKVKITYPQPDGNQVLFYRISYSASDVNQPYDFASRLDNNIINNDYDYEALKSVGEDQQRTGILRYEDNSAGIPFPSDKEYMTVWAIAAPKVPKDVPYSEVVRISYSSQNRPGMQAPRLMADADAASQSQYYSQATVFTLTHDDAALGNIFYKINDNGGWLTYTQNNPLDLYGAKNTSNVTKLQTYFERAGYPQSIEATYTVRFDRAMAAAEYQLTGPYGEPADSRSLHKTGNTLTFTIPNSSIPESLRPDSSNTLGNLTPSEYDERIPQIHYTITTDGSDPAEPTTSSTAYRAAAPALTGPESREAREAEKITIEGTAGQVIKLRYKLLPQQLTEGGFAESASGVITMQIRDDLSAPTSSPLPDAGSISRHTVIELFPSAGEPDTDIYYTLDESVPAVQWDNSAKQYVIQNSSTLRFDTRTPIRVDETTSSTLNIYALTVSRKDTLGESVLKKFRFTISELPQADVIQALPTTSVTNPTGLRPGETIILTTATLDAEIHYTLNGSTPRPGEPGTFIYSDSGIPMPNQGRFVITALVHDPTGKSYSDSAPQQFVYVLSDLDRADAPIALPETSNNNPTTLSRGDKITLRSDTLGTDIYYTTDGSIPDPDRYGQAGDSTMLYQAAIPMAPAGDDALFIINAVARDRTGSSYSDSTVSQHTYAIAKAQAPVSYPQTSDTAVATLQPGDTITLSSVTTGAEIYYTTDRSAPNPGSSGTLRYTTGITMPASTTGFFTITAVAVHPNGNVADSDVARFSYQLPAPVQAVSASPGAGEVVKGTEVTLSTTTDGAAIYYEVAYKDDSPNNATPFASQPYSKDAPIVVDQDTTISAVAYKDGISSAVTTYEYTMADQVKTPEANIPAGSVVPRGAKLTLRSTSGASIIYTKDGSDPSDPANKNRMYGTAIALDAEEGKSVSLSVYATKAGMTPSETASFSYTIAKNTDVITANPPTESTVSPGDGITFSTAVSGGTIYYTTDGTDPVVGGRATYEGGNVKAEGRYGDSFVIRAVVSYQGGSSMPQTFVYSLVEQTSAPSASIPDGAVVMAGAKVALSAPEGIIYYTLDGSEPNTSSQMYTEPFELSGSTVLKAIAVAEGKAPSIVAEYIYTMAGYVAAPTASTPSGTLVAGAQVALSTTTEGATIYYSTNGTDPTDKNLKDLSVYDSPIVISRPVTIKMFAVKSGMHSSAINSATYTVENPLPEEKEQEGEDEGQYQTGIDKLFLFDQYVGTGDGPLYSDIVLRDPVTQVVVTAQQGVLPDSVRLEATQDRSPSTELRDNVKRTLDLRLESMYELTLYAEDQTVQPQRPDAVEVGIPIPKGYEDAIVLVCHISDNGTVTGYPTRRSGGVAYAVVDHFSKYAIAVPDYADPISGQIPWIPILQCAAGAVITVTLLLVWRKKRRSVKGASS